MGSRHSDTTTIKRTTLVIRRIVVGALAATAVAGALAEIPATAQAAEPPPLAESISTGSAGVRTVVVNDYSIIITLYSPAPDVTESQLHSDLAARGAAGLQSLETTAGPPPCSSGTAAPLACPEIRWDPDPALQRVPALVFGEGQASTWPISEVVPLWRNPYVSLGASTACPLIRNFRCIATYRKDFGATGWIAKTTVSYSWSITQGISSANITLNDAYVTVDATFRRNALCHQVGHVIGVGHNSSPTSCMYAGNGTAVAPNLDDTALVASLYRTS